MAKETFGQRLRRLRQKFNISQDQVAEALRTTRQTVSNWENDKCAIDYFSLQDLKTILRCSWDELMGGDEAKYQALRNSAYTTLDDQQTYVKECWEHGLVYAHTNIATLSKPGLYYITTDDLSASYKFAYYLPHIVAMAKEFKLAGFDIRYLTHNGIWVNFETGEEAKKFKALLDEMTTDHYEHAPRYGLTYARYMEPLRSYISRLENKGLKDVFDIKGDHLFMIKVGNEGPMAYAGSVEEAKEIAKKRGFEQYSVDEMEL